jgi:hypothetical protein
VKRLVAATVLLVAIATAARAEDVYAGVGPATYCLWNRTGLPAAQQRICAARNQKAAAPSWRTIEADNGAVVRIDVNSIFRYSNGTADIVTYAMEGDRYNPENQRKLWFDCQGHYRDETAGGPTLYAPPRSMVGRISDIACGH